MKKKDSIHKSIIWIATGGLTAGAYIVLTLLSNALGLASGAVQVRLSEVLCVLPAFTPAAIPGLFAGCLCSNLITGCAAPDILFGSLATLAGAFGTRALAKHRFLCLLPPVAANVLVIPVVLAKVYGVEMAWPMLALLIFAGEAVSCGVLGYLFYGQLEKNKGRLKF